MDLAGINIHENYAQWSAIRGLQYGSGLKVAIKFSTPWWETELPKPIHGGQSYTDLPIRNVIYPSYPQGAKPEDVSKVLIASFCGVQDADRLGTFVNRDGTAEPELIDYVFRDLAAVHGVTVEWLKRFYTDGDYFAWDWSRHPLSMGTYAIFGPGVYGDADLYRQIISPAARGKLFFAGEATAMCHTWVVAALHSAWRAVDQYLTLHHPEKLDEFWKSWGKTEYWDEVTDGGLANLEEKLSG
jgi:monoamine oxidase